MWHVLGGKRGAYKFLVVKPDGKKPPERPRCRWNDNIKIDAEIVGWGGMEWIYLAKRRSRWRALLNAVMNLFVPQN
jgi:hypothetical protein